MILLWGMTGCLLSQYMTNNVFTVHPVVEHNGRVLPLRRGGEVRVGRPALDGDCIKGSAVKNGHIYGFLDETCAATLAALTPVGAAQQIALVIDDEVYEAYALEDEYPRDTLWLKLGSNNDAYALQTHLGW